MPSNRALLKAHGLAPKKSWGQNFLEDANALDRIQAACRLAPGETVVEIGAGLGALTERLLGEERRVIAIERDRELVPVLRERFADAPGLELVEANAVTYPLAEAAGGAPVKVVGNLPYQLSAPILFKLIEERAMVTSAHILLQTEVAERLCAQPDSKDYSLLTVLLGRVAEVRAETDIKPVCFVPAPRVGSRFLSAWFNRDTHDQPPDALFTALVKGAFHQRRKTLANSLARQPFLPLNAEQIGVLKARFPERMSARPEQLAVAEFVELARAVADITMHKNQ